MVRNSKLWWRGGSTTHNVLDLEFGGEFSVTDEGVRFSDTRYTTIYDLMSRRHTLISLRSVLSVYPNMTT
jgi:hypothetical protein